MFEGGGGGEGGRGGERIVRVYPEAVRELVDDCSETRDLELGAVARVDERLWVGGGAARSELGSWEGGGGRTRGSHRTRCRCRRALRRRNSVVSCRTGGERRQLGSSERGSRTNLGFLGFVREGEKRGENRVS